MDNSRRSFLQYGFLLTTSSLFRYPSDDFHQTASDDQIKRLCTEFGKRTSIKVFISDNDLKGWESDFGKLYQSIPEAVIQPTSSAEVRQVIEFLSKEKIKTVIRGEGHSQSGQSLPASRGVTVDMRAMKKIISIDKESLFITCEAGCTWRELVEYCKSYQLIPLVMPMFVDLSIGGTVSAGGVGSTSFKYGISASIVEEMDVVLANGSLVTCNRDVNKDAFDAVLANTGQVGVICTLKLKLRKYKPETITYYLIYDDIQKWLKDQQSLANSHCDHIQGFFSYNIQGLRRGRPFVIWFYGLQVAFEFSDSNDRKGADEVVQKLSPYRRLGEEVDKTEQFAYRFDPRFQAMRQSGAFMQPHPWMEFILPVGKLETVIPTILDKLPFAMGDGHRLVFINPSGLPGNFKVPEGSGLAVFAALPTAIATPQLQDVLPKLKELNEYVVAAGGKRYLSGWLGMMENAEWRQHWGDKYSSWVNQKNKFDPENLFRSKLTEETFTR